MNNGLKTQNFLAKLDQATQDDILGNIAKHYGISIEEAKEEVCDPEAENLIDYVTGPNRPAIALMYSKMA